MPLLQTYELTKRFGSDCKGERKGQQFGSEGKLLLSLGSRYEVLSKLVQKYLSSDTMNQTLALFSYSYFSLVIHFMFEGLIQSAIPIPLHA